MGWFFDPDNYPMSKSANCANLDLPDICAFSNSSEPLRAPPTQKYPSKIDVADEKIMAYELPKLCDFLGVYPP